MAGFTNRFRAALIFLGVLLFIAIILVLLYLILKKDICNCFGDKKTDNNEQKETEGEEAEGDSVDDEMVALEEQNDISPELEKEGDCLGIDYSEHVVPVVLITDEDSKNIMVKQNKHSTLKSALKKIARPLNKVRFGAVTASEEKPLVEEELQTTTYNTSSTFLSTMHRSDSMESFVSSASAVSSANIVEFGEEVSPGRLQVSIEYSQRNWTLYIEVKQADGMFTTSREKLYWQVHVALLPFKRQRFKTKYKSSSSPAFNQIYEVENIAAQALPQVSVRFRIYGKAGKAGRKKLAGEAEVHLSGLKGGEVKIAEWLILKKKGENIKKI